MSDLRYKLVNERNISSLELGSQALSECMKELTSAQDALENTLESAVERMTLFTKFENTSRETNAILKEVNETKQKIGSSRSKSSRLTTASTTSTARQRRLNLEEELATLKAKMHMAGKKEELDEANRKALENLDEIRLQLQKEETRVKEEIQNATKRFQIAEELAEKKARIDACKKFEEEVPNADNYVRENTNAAESTPPNDPKLTPELCLLNPSTPEFVPNAVPSISTNQQDTIPPVIEKIVTNPVLNAPSLVQAQLDVISKLLEVQNQNRLPLPEPGIFNGDPLQFPIWLKAFETLIEGRAINPAERLHFLGKYVTGEAKELIKGFMLLDGEDAYQKAKEMLSKRFGDSFAVAAAF
ncbi:Hypothetical predicted protein [Paramuricea clavata]|uniref:Uncharacterized protein n=1 Tax=Paramuricea clavata TaxID=317549 RepID=A0A7D9LG46_PARCT|nr:Hypothetical predicted protein [Paramuricea clavata]